MADNFALMQGSGTRIASDDVDGIHVLRVKVQTGADGTASDVSIGNPLPVEVRAAGLSVFRVVGLGASAQVARDTPGRVFGWHLANNSSSGAFVKLYDTLETPVVGTDVPTMTLYVPAGGAISAEHPNGLVFATGIHAAATTGASAGNTGAPTAGAVIVNLFHADVDVSEADSSGGYGTSVAGVVAPSPNTIAKRDSAGRLYAAGYDAGGERISNVAAPVQASDAATKAYVDTRPPVLVAGLVSVATATFTVIGRAQLDPTRFPEGTAFTLRAIIEATPGQTAELRLYNVTDGAAVTGSTLSTSSTTPTLVSAAVSLPSALKIYEVQLRMTSTLAPSGRATCSRVEITN
ncbi:hypothetical protein A7982_12112 [Minicystis rosea]|nr:hypothetical protein A7982_12112 [Minicystis rosea]